MSQKNGKTERAARMTRRAAVMGDVGTGAEREMREHAAEWVGKIRLLLESLTSEVREVARAASGDSLLSRVLSADELERLENALSNADTEASNLRVLGRELPLPDLVAVQERLSSRQPRVANV